MSAMSNPLDAPDDIRKAVRQLNFAYRRSAETIRNAGPDARTADAMRRAEAVLFAAGEPLSAAQIAAVLPPGADAATVLMALQAAYAERGVNLVEVGGRWRFQTAEDLAFLFVEERQQQKKLSQAALETLAIIAYGQPVTRAEIEAVRGVAVSKGTVDQLMEAGWVRIKGRRRTPGRPVTYGTTSDFLEHFGLESLEVLPGRAELEADGLLSNVIPDGFAETLSSGDGDHGGGAETDEGSALHDAEFVTDYLGEDDED